MPVSNNHRIERFQYVNIYDVKNKANWRERHRVRDSSDLGEVIEATFGSSSLKDELREIADRLRGHKGQSALRADHDRMNELLIEANRRGWSTGDMARIMKCGTSTARSRLNRALALREEDAA